MDEATVVQALAALVDGDVEAARRAVAGGSSLVATALAAYLADQLAGAVYDQPAAFEAFIRGGGNVPLYAAVSTALADLYDEHHPARLLDVGCGDGMALLPALHAAAHPPARLDLLEPSPVLLDAALSQLRQAQLRQAQHQGALDAQLQLRTWPVTLQSFVCDLDTAARPDAGRAWPMAQATFALHTLPHRERTGALRALRPHVRLLAAVEFDVPDVEVGSVGHLRFLARTYEQGLSEYTDDRDLVAHGFLMPVLAGQLSPGAVRATWEQPATAWAEQLRDAGYTDVSTRPLFDYWSSPAFLLTAQGDLSAC